MLRNFRRRACELKTDEAFGIGCPADPGMCRSIDEVKQPIFRSIMPEGDHAPAPQSAEPPKRSILPFIYHSTSRMAVRNSSPTISPCIKLAGNWSNGRPKQLFTRALASKTPIHIVRLKRWSSYWPSPVSFPIFIAIHIKKSDLGLYFCEFSITSLYHEVLGV